MDGKITYLLLKAKTNTSRRIKIIQNHGFTSRFLKGAYDSSPNTPSRKPSNREYSLSKSDKNLSVEKKFLINSIIYRF